MDLLALAVPFFVLALLLEIAVDRVRGTGHYRISDAINSISTGTLMTTFGYFTGFIPIIFYGFVLQNFGLFDIDMASFDTSPRGIAYWLAALFAWDFCYYWQHRYGHEISILWASHAVHHQSEDYNLSTALRQTSSGFLFSWIFYLPLFLIGLPLRVVGTVYAVDLIYQFWVHTQHIRKLGWVDRVFVTPSNHRVHHAQNEVYIDRNYGGILILWDRLFGTFQEELDSEPVVFGVRKPLESWNPFWANLQVYSYLWFDAVRTKKWRDKLGVWYRRTGWRPSDVAEQFPKRKTDLKTFHKYDPESTTAIRRYVLVQFALTILGILWIGVVYAEQGAGAAALPCLLLWITLYSFGLLNEGRVVAVRLEAIRLLVIVPIMLAVIKATGTIGIPLESVALYTGLYVIVSVAGLWFAGRTRHRASPAIQAVRE
jgi:sterol desaturase/sphingolipid hydroxylase (fatty acid hydroxylase superfamily)